jgi:signal transduction histidine kinase
MESVREEERTKMAREIHDELGQTLTALKIDLSWLAKRLPEDHEPLVEKTQVMYEVVEEAIQTVKRLSAELRPAALDDLGLADAIEWQTQQFTRRTDIKSVFQASPEHMVLDPDLSTAVFRICQEALTNVARHAQATNVVVCLQRRSGQLTLTVSDDGKGIEQGQILDPKAFGLIGMRERVVAFGGQVTVTGVAGKGTFVVVTFPLAAREVLQC